MMARNNIGDISTRIQLLERNINVISRFMESFNHGTALPPAMINAFRRIEAVETEMKKMKENEKKKPVRTEEKKTGVDAVIETTEIVSRDEKCPLKTAVDTVIADVKKIRVDLDDRNKDIGIKLQEFTKMETEIEKLSGFIKNLQEQLDESRKLIEELKAAQLTESVSSVVEGGCDGVSHGELNAAMKKQKEEIINEVTDKIDEEIIGLEERLKSGKMEGKCENMEDFMTKISGEMNNLEKRLTDRIAAVAEGVIGEDDEILGEEEDDEENTEEEDDLDGCIDMD